MVIDAIMIKQHIMKPFYPERKHCAGSLRMLENNNSFCLWIE
jgi:hypothetical protein